MKQKTIYKFFTVADYHQEEEYLRRMHQAGWKLSKVSYSVFLVAVKYTFESCQPEDVIYQLDFQPLKKEEKANYLQLFADFGWEYLQSFNGFAYFCKAASEIGQSEEFEIYNDTASKLQMIKRILCQRFVPVLMMVVIFLNYGGFRRVVFHPVFLLVMGIPWMVVSIQLLHIARTLYKQSKQLKDEA